MSKKIIKEDPDISEKNKILCVQIMEDTSIPVKGSNWKNKEKNVGDIEKENVIVGLSNWHQESQTAGNFQAAVVFQRRIVYPL